ncbi:MAG: aminotransferase class IV, partial [Desulfovibrionaceae bacterium]|nr:aminotransferase class IV [Desulfovibrionaceae bacterium]
KGFDYPLCFNEHGFLAEGATENVCLVNRRGALHIPEFTNALAGTTLMRAVDLIKGELEIIFRPIREDEILEAREVIIVGTTVDAVSVVRYEGKPIFDVRPGPVSRRLRELLMNDLRENGLEF